MAKERSKDRDHFVDESDAGANKLGGPFKPSDLSPPPAEKIDPPDIGPMPQVLMQREPTRAEAFAIIKRDIEAGVEFTNEEKDLGIRLSLPAIPEGERQWFWEIADMNGLRLWQVLWGQWRRCHEWGVANAPVCDPDWTPVMKRGLDKAICEICQKEFQPNDPRQRYCGNACGAEAERRERHGAVRLEKNETADTPGGVIETTSPERP